MSRRTTSPLAKTVQGLFTIITLPYRRTFWLYTWKPLRDIGAANGDGKLLIPLVKAWKADKYDELQSVQVAATFCGGAAFSCLPWTRSNNTIWVAEALWFGSLVCSMFAIITSIQTKSILDDLPSSEELNVTSLPNIEVRRMQRTILRYRNTPGIKHWVMIFIWQFPSMTMAYAWCTFIMGLTVYTCSPFIQRLPWENRHKIATVYLAFSLVGLVTYISATIFVYAGEKDYERSVAGSCTKAISPSPTNTLTIRGIILSEVEDEAEPNKIRAHVQTKHHTASSTVLEEECPVQAAQSKSPREPGASRENVERSRRLLY